MRQRLGSAVGSVAVALAVLTLLVAVSVQTGLYHLHFSTENEMRDHARDLAESAVQLTISRLCTSISLGQAHEAGADVMVPASPGYPQGAWGGLTFHPAQAARWGCRYSTNNIEGAGSVAGDRRTVPRHSCHLVGMGSCGGVQAQVEVVLERPPFPLGCVAKGPVELNNVTLWGLPPQVPFRPNQVPAQPLPAHIFSNAPGATAVNVGAGCRISGNAGAVGQVAVDPAALVQGEVQSGASRQEIPPINVSDVVTRLGTVGGLVPFVANTPIVSYCVVNSSLDVAGDVVLDGGVLAVRGDLRVSGTIKGRGAVFADGNVTVARGSNLVTDRQCAVASTGNLTFGGSTGAYLFQGLLYANGEIYAHNITVVGTIVADGRAGTEKVRLKDVTLVQTAVAIQGGHGFPLQWDLGGTDSFAMSIHAEPDPSDPNGTRMLFYGEAIYSEDGMNGNPLWPRTDRLWYRRWGDGVVTLMDGRNQVFFPANTTTRPYDGSRAALVSQIQQMMDVNRGYSAAKLARINAYLDSLQNGVVDVDVYNLNLNNLLAPVEQSRVLYWREGAPNS